MYLCAVAAAAIAVSNSGVEPFEKMFSVEMRDYIASEFSHFLPISMKFGWRRSQFIE